MLEEMLAIDPADPFLRFGLAMELAKEGNTDEAVKVLGRLIADQPGYIPAYFQAARIEIERGAPSEAADQLRRGIAAARAQSNTHAAEEMSALLAQLE